MSMKIGYHLSSEEMPPADMVRWGRAAEELDFSGIAISDHFHPWTSRQGQSPFVWSVLGALASTTRLRLGTSVTCPTVRIHPAIVAQAAATTASMAPGRFFLGVGSGEALNEHILGDRWPETDVRLAMLREAVEVMRALWTGDQVSHHGEHYTVENAQLYTCPDESPPVIVSGFGPKAATLAAEIGDGYFGTSPESDLLETYDGAGGSGTKMALMKVCWGEDEQQARELAHELWPTIGVPGELSQELPMPAHFEQASERVSVDDVADVVSCGPDPKPYLESLGQYEDAGYDEVFVHQIGPDQHGFFDFWRREIAPAL
jgi:G6PDH family F420-dependent oxidoreductase